MQQLLKNKLNLFWDEMEETNKLILRCTTSIPKYKA